MHNWSANANDNDIIAKVGMRKVIRPHVFYRMTALWSAKDKINRNYSGKTYIIIIKTYIIIFPAKTNEIRH